MLKRNKLGQLHCNTSPAAIWADGLVIFYQNGQQSRRDGPSAIYPSGELYYKINDVLHRIGGPAIVKGNSFKEFWIDGKFVNL